VIAVPANSWNSANALRRRMRVRLDTMWMGCDRQRPPILAPVDSAVKTLYSSPVSSGIRRQAFQYPPYQSQQGPIVTSRIAATSKRPAKGRAAFACAYARGRHLFALHLASAMQPGLFGVAHEDMLHPGGGSA
jgi:hypothetical protein